MTGDRVEGSERLGGWGGRACIVVSNCGERRIRGREEVGGGVRGGRGYYGGVRGRGKRERGKRDGVGGRG